MDDHMLDRLAEEIKLCFMCVELELEEGQNIKEHYQYKSAAVLIKAYNSLVKLYYAQEYVESELKGNVDKEYRLYLENKN